MDTTFHCTVCNLDKPTQKEGGTGYGQDKDGNKVCYACCAIQDRKEMDETGKFVGYLSKGKDEKWEFTNWPGTLRFPANIKKNNHNWHNTQRTDCWFVVDGFVWHGINLGDMQICRARRTKTKA